MNGRTKSLRRGTMAALVALVVPGGAMEVAGQKVGGGQGTTVLTLREALDRATRFNLSYRQALDQLEQQSPPRRQW